MQGRFGESSVCCLFQPAVFNGISTRLFKYNPNSAEQLAAIEGAVKDRREQAVVIPCKFRWRKVFENIWHKQHPRRLADTSKSGPGTVNPHFRMFFFKT